MDDAAPHTAPPRARLTQHYEEPLAGLQSPTKRHRALPPAEMTNGLQFDEILLFKILTTLLYAF